MPFPQVYTQAFPSPKLAQAVDLTAGDWIAPAGSVLVSNPQSTSMIYVGVAGDLQVMFAGDPATAVLLKAHPAGYAQIGIVRVVKAGTTASGIVALF